MTWDRVAARYGCLPSRVNELTPEELVVAIEALEGAEKDKFRFAAFPVWLEHGKKGEKFGKFLRKLGLGSKVAGSNKSQKLSRAQLDDLYAKAEDIRSRIKDATV